MISPEYYHSPESSQDTKRLEELRAKLRAEEAVCARTNGIQSVEVGNLMVAIAEECHRLYEAGVSMDGQPYDFNIQEIQNRRRAAGVYGGQNMPIQSFNQIKLIINIIADREHPGQVNLSLINEFTGQELQEMVDIAQHYAQLTATATTQFNKPLYTPDVVANIHSQFSQIKRMTDPNISTSSLNSEPNYFDGSW